MTQTEAILRHLKSGKAITPIDALNEYGCFRLAARINDLRAQGYSIQTETICKNDKQYASYRLAQPSQPELPLGAA